MELTFKEGYMEPKYPVNVPTEDLLSITRDINESATILFYYLHSKGMRWKWIDENIAKDLGWTVRKVQTYKRKLKEAGWIFYWNQDGNKYTYLGKEAVNNGKKDYTER